MFKGKEKVFDSHFGWGTILEIRKTGIYPVIVDFTWTTEDFTIDGRYEENSPRSLYHYDYTPTEETPLKSSPELLREKFAGMAMQGILSGNISQLLGDDITSDRIACLAIDCTAELIKALNEK